MALSDGDNKIRRELRIHERLDDLRADLADYIAEISDASVQARGVFSIAISGGSLIGLLGYLYLIFFIYVSMLLEFGVGLRICCCKQKTLGSSL